MSNFPNSDTYSIRVQNIPNSVSREDLVALFNALIGSVSKYEESFSNISRSLVITFTNRDAHQKALCMSGYTLAGSPILVTSLPPQNENIHANATRQKDPRRNLYVLGLPFDFTKAEFTALFAQYGTVSHCVILATRDSASRRRGFVVMSTHEEAKLAMGSLSRKPVKGVILDISWAVVQRSEGFLDGGDRVAQFDSRSPSAEDSPTGDAETHRTELPNPVGWKADAPFGVSLTPTSTILVTGLPSALFSEILDLHPLLCPFGCIKTLKILDSGLGDLCLGKTSVLVEYSTVSSAKEAKEALHGQFYACYPVCVLYIQVSPPEHGRLGLNPFAQPFFHESHSCSCSMSSASAQGFAKQLQHTTTGFHDQVLGSLSSLGIGHPLYSQRSATSRSSSANSRLSSDSFDGSGVRCQHELYAEKRNRSSNFL